MAERTRTLALALAAFAAACAPDFRPAARLLGQSAPQPREPFTERRRSYFDSDAKQLSRERGVLVQSDGSVVPHGRDVAYYSSGLMRHDRGFERGEPRGRWRSWHENGALECEAFYEPGERTTMTWRREDGSLSSSGELFDGLRDGEWRSWHSNGVLASRGAYVRGERHGPWIFWNDAGELVECGDYLADERIGAWERGSRAVPANSRR